MRTGRSMAKVKWPILEEIRACQVCAAHLPLGAKPLVAASPRSRMVLIGQAPGRAAHESGIPWNDRSGDTLRGWLGLDAATFYDPDSLALMPMGFCYPGKGKSGDLAPRPECAPLWHEALLGRLPQAALRVFIGQYPLARYYPGKFDSLTAAVRSFATLLPGAIVLPHPSPRNALWLARNPWFNEEVIPELRKAVRAALKERDRGCRPDR